MSSLSSTLVKGTLGGIENKYAARAENARLEQQAALERDRAENAKIEARLARERALRSADEQREQSGLFIGAQRAKSGASGALADSGSFLDINLWAAEQGERDALALEHAGEVESWRYNLRAKEHERAGQSLRQQKKNKRSLLLDSAFSSARGLPGAFGAFTAQAVRGRP